MFIEMSTFTVVMVASYLLGILTMPLLLYVFLTTMGQRQSTPVVGTSAGASQMTRLRKPADQQQNGLEPEGEAATVPAEQAAHGPATGTELSSIMPAGSSDSNRLQL